MKKLSIASTKTAPVKTAPAKTAPAKATEAQNVASIKILNSAVDTFTRISNNKDMELFHKQAVDFRNGLVGVTVAKNGYYTIPQAQNDYIDLLIDKNKSGYRATRQAIKCSLVACFYLGMNGTNAKSYLDKANKGTTALEALTDIDWAVIKRDCNKKRNTAKASKAVVANTTKTPVAPVVSNTTKTPVAPVVSNTTKAPVTPIKTSVSPSQDRINKAYNMIIGTLTENDIVILMGMLEEHMPA